MLVQLLKFTSPNSYSCSAFFRILHFHHTSLTTLMFGYDAKYRVYWTSSVMEDILQLDTITAWDTTKSRSLNSSTVAEKTLVISLVAGYVDTCRCGNSKQTLTLTWNELLPFFQFHSVKT